MNHDYAYCLDWTPDCPKDCFRAQLERDLIKRKINIAEIPIIWMSFGETPWCKRAKKKQNAKEKRRQND